MMLVLIRRLDLRMHEGYWATEQRTRHACLQRRQISTSRHTFMISEESASRCHMCASYEDSTAMNRDQCHCLYAVVCMHTCLKAISYNLNSNPRCMKLTDKAWFA